VIVLEDAQPDRAFEAKNLLTERRLTHVQPFCRSPEVQFFRKHNRRLKQVNIW
jgi:hypothetical protein